jgi:uncharacterized Zn-binding protein involved in type VI secretion
LAEIRAVLKGDAMTKTLLAAVLIMILTLSLAGCNNVGNKDTMAQIQAWLNDYRNNGQDNQESDGGTTGPVSLKLTYPAGRSAKVFTHGWIFGVRCTSNGKDCSDYVKWSGTGAFSPDAGARSRPSFSGEGANTIILSVNIDGKLYTKSFKVNAKSPAGYAYVGCKAFCPADAHGGPADPLPVVGPITTGSSHVFVNGRPAARVGDVGIHAACVGPNTFKIVGGDSEVMIDGKPAAKVGSSTQHCGGMGHIIEGASD